MPGPTYNWTRFWCLREGSYSLSDNGFLSDPESEYGNILNPHVQKFEQIAPTRCLVLLGEPGIGKSHELTRAKLAEEAAATARGDIVLSFDLRAFQTDVRLCDRLFDSAEFRQWQAGDHRLHLFLDSLDEGLIRINTLAALLAEEFGRCPVGRLSLRITCRTAEWPHSLEQDLKRLWGEAHVNVLELVPLRRRDVQEAARAEGIDADRFLAGVFEMHAVPLAIKPVTLRMMINVFKGTQALPSRQADLYCGGCRLLCEETNEGRRDANLPRPLSPDALLAVAGRIAAVTVFGNRYAIWTGIDAGSVPPEDATVRQLAGGSESVESQGVEVTEDAIREALKTGLFSSRGPHRMGWAHQTYAEFLAARYLDVNDMTQGQMMSLIVHPDDPGQRLVPQLYETAAWLAGMRPEVFRAIIDNDPEVLLRSDVASAEPEDRRRLVDVILAVYAHERFTPGSLDLQSHYRKLAHPGLAEQLRPHVIDKNAHWLVRRVAIDIADACKVAPLVPELVRIALDQTEATDVRKNAAYAVVNAGDSAAKAKLKPLAMGQAGADPADDLKGCGLRAVWPDHMTTQELFAVLTRRKKSNYAGAYVGFRMDLSKRLLGMLKPEDLPFALDWIARGDDDGHDIEGLSERILLTAWEALGGNRELVAPFARVAVARLRSHRPIAAAREDHPFRQAVKRDIALRRAVLAAAMETLAPKGETFSLVYNETPLATSEDVSWLAERVLEAPPEKKDVWLSLINWVFNPNTPGHLEKVLGLCRRDTRLARGFLWLKAVEIESPEGRQLKADYLRHNRLQQQLAERRTRPLVTPPPKERVLALLDGAEAGNQDAWWQLNLEMTLEPDSQYYGDEFEWDLTVLPGWRDADNVTRERILAAAKQYVSTPPTMDGSWLGTNTLHRPACAGYRAIALLHDTVPAFLEALHPESWATWAPIIIAFPLQSSDLWNKSPHTDLVRAAYLHAPAAVLAALSSFSSESDRLDHCWDDRISAVLLEKAYTPGMNSDHVRSLLYQLIKHAYPPAIEYAISLLVIPLTTDAAARTVVMNAAKVLITCCPHLAWDRLWPIIEADAMFGRELLEEMAHWHGDERTGRLGNLSEGQVADLYLWLVQQYPPETDPRHEGASFVGPRESITWFREGLLSHLTKCGTAEGCAQLRRISARFPAIDRLKWAVQEAEEHTRRQTWKPLEPQQIIALAQDRQRRYVENGRQLLDVLAESLGHLQELLQGENPSAVELWDNRGDTRRPNWCPVDELRLSGWVARHLQERLSGSGIVINREVQIRRDQATDIHVDAVMPGEQDRAAGAVSAIIEVKGCWNRELDTSMETQLVGRYLKDNQCPNGLYLVGWFNCDQWSDSDYRKADATRCSLAEARPRFAEQAGRLQVAAAIPLLVLRAIVVDAALR